jgi:hypothetical protein
LKRAEAGVVAGNDYEAWACLFRLWLELGHEDRASELATQASLHEDEDIRDVGTAFLESHGP